MIRPTPSKGYGNETKKLLDSLGDRKTKNINQNAMNWLENMPLLIINK